MDGLRFTWDDKKDALNRRKHGVSFEEARTAFYDESAKLYFDPDHSASEHRFILLGMSLRLRVLIVCHCSRKADPQEQGDYWS
jgi:uncharacterized protein